jgi:hypothetical protein
LASAFGWGYFVFEFLQPIVEVAKANGGFEDVLSMLVEVHQSK